MFPQKDIKCLSSIFSDKECKLCFFLFVRVYSCFRYVYGFIHFGVFFLKHLEGKSPHTICSLSSKPMWKNAKKKSGCVREKWRFEGGTWDITTCIKKPLFNCNNGFKRAEHSTWIVCPGMHTILARTLLCVAMCFILKPPHFYNALTNLYQMHLPTHPPLSRLPTLDKAYVRRKTNKRVENL